MTSQNAPRGGKNKGNKVVYRSNSKCQASLDEILRKLSQVAGSNGNYTALCPAHADTNPSLSITEKEGKVLVCCHAGCKYPDIMAAIGLKPEPDTANPRPRIIAVYDYRHADSSLNYQVCRFAPKDFRARRNEDDWSIKGCKRTPYRLERWHDDDKAVYIVEGEKDVHAMESLGLNATCNSGGAGKFTREHAIYIKGRACIILPDNDDAGEDHAEKAARALHGLAKSIQIIRLPDLPAKGDVTDWIDAQRRNGVTDAAIKSKLEELAKGASGLDLQDGRADNNPLPEVLLPGDGKLVSEFAREVFATMGKAQDVFLYSDAICTVRYSTRLDVKTGEDRTVSVFERISAPAMVTHIEKYITPVKERRTKESAFTVPYSIGEALARQLIHSQSAQGLPPVDMLSSVRLPYFQGKDMHLTDPGYDARHAVWTVKDSPEMDIVPIEAACKEINSLLDEFCFFEHDLDMARAVAMLLTPILRLIVGESRAMVFYASGNRPGVGKDLLIGLPSVIYTGREPCYYSPCTTDDEYRKLIFAACNRGEEFVLISNISGHLKCDPLEQGATSPRLAGRVLGISENRQLANTGLWAISGNNLTMSEDMERRCLEIRLESYEENISNQRFRRDDLYRYAAGRRQEILSALLSLAANWHALGQQKGTPVRSFTSWSQAAGGILQAAGYKDPFSQRERLSGSMKAGGNRETACMKKLVEGWWSAFTNTDRKAAELRGLIAELELFPWLDLEQRSGQTRFAAMLAKYSGREFSGFRLHVDTEGRVNTYFLEEVSR